VTSVDLSSVINLADFERLAHERMEPAHFDYVAGGAADELTLATNEAAWQRWRLRPRVLVDVSSVDTSTHLLGSAAAIPVGLAPVAFQHLANRDAEPAGAAAASRAGVLYCLSTMSSHSLEDVARAADEAGEGPRWFQLYVHRDRQRSADLVQRAAAAGYGALVVTVDFPVAGRRERDVRNRLPYPQVYGNFELPARATDGSPLPAVIGGLNDAALTWGDVAWLRGLSELPLVVKGILTGEDAVLAVEHGAAGVWVSNHGGRQLDRTPSTAEVLAEVVDVVAGRAEIYVDGGIRRAADVLAALALGAQAVFIGRPAVYALAVGGEAGVARALDIIGAELHKDMALLGVTAVGQLTRERVVRAG
jgi:4-hydroxymandelate oxidase